MPAPFFNDHQVSAPRFADAVKRVFGLKGSVHPEILDKIQVGIQLNDLSGPEYLRPMRGSWCRVAFGIGAVAAQQSGVTVRFPANLPNRYIAIVRQLVYSAGGAVGYGVLQTPGTAPFGTNTSSLPLDSRDDLAGLGGSMQVNLGTSAAPGYGITGALTAATILNAGIFRPGHQFAMLGPVNAFLNFEMLIEVREAENAEVS